MSTSVPVMERRPPAASPNEPRIHFHALILDAIRARMDDADMSAYRLRQETGLSAARVYRWFRREYPISLDELVIVAAALKVDVLDLMVDAKTRYDEATQ